MLILLFARHIKTDDPEKIWYAAGVELVTLDFLVVVILAFIAQIWS